MNGNPRVPASRGGRSDAPTVIWAGCAQILLPEIKFSCQSKARGRPSPYRPSPYHAEHLG